jgi:hypothetical protein
VPALDIGKTGEANRLARNDLSLLWPISFDTCTLSRTQSHSSAWRCVGRRYSVLPFRGHKKSVSAMEQPPPLEPMAHDAAAPDIIAPATEPESERALLAQLDRMVQSGQVRMTIDRRKLSHLDFPMSSEADGNIWVYSLVPLTALVWWQIGSWAGLASAAASFALYQTAGRAYVARRLDRRIRERGIKDMEAWRALWRFGGVILTPADGKPCQGPEGNWHAIARGAGKGR